MNAGRAAALDITGLRFRWAAHESWLLDIPALQIARGERVFLAGPSGCGKSTLLSLIAGILLPVDGRIAVLGTSLATLRGAARDRFRAEHLGILFQSFNLLPYLSVLDNVLLGCRFSPARRARAAAAAGTPADDARRLLARLGLADPALLARAATALSVGQQQRVAAARALIGGPALIVADEPTSALDADTRDDFMRLLLQETTAAGTALLFVSHERALGRTFDRCLDLRGLAPAAA